MRSELITPQPLQEGSVVAIISPATIVKDEYVDGAAQFLRDEGFESRIMPHAKGPASGSYASCYESRLGDFLAAWHDPEVKGVLCARGGYGSAHLLPALDAVDLRANAKWLMGFSDISAFHAALVRAGVKSLHAPMAKHMCENPDNRATKALLSLLRGGRMDYTVEGHPLNREGCARGMLTGGNLAVLNGLADTPYDLLAMARERDVILFVEDVSEKIYAVERMLWRLYMAGILGSVKGLVMGQFTDYSPDRNHQDMEHMANALLKRAGLHHIPVAYGFPVGHVDDNLPLVEGEMCELTIKSGADGVRLRSLCR